MSRPKNTSPRLDIKITDEEIAHAVQSNSGGCLIADAIKRQYPNLTCITVDMATIRATDRQRGERYTYLTPAMAQHVLLSFDQGWPNPTDELTIRSAVHISKITEAKNAPSRKLNSMQRAERLAVLEEKVAHGIDLTKTERSALTRMRRAAARKVDRPTSAAPAEVVVQRGGVTVVGGRPPVVGKPHPNLLRGRNRHFGAKLADPGQAFREAVEAELRHRSPVNSVDIIGD